MSDTHSPADPGVNPSVRYERSDAHFGGVAAFGVGLVVVCVLCCLLLWWLYTTSVVRQAEAKRSQSPWPAEQRAGSTQQPHTPRQPGELGTERSGIDPIPPRLEGLGEPVIGQPGKARQQLDAEDDYLARAPWRDRETSTIHIPIEMAMKALAGKLPVRKADGEAAGGDDSQPPSRSRSGRAPKEDKP